MTNRDVQILIVEDDEMNTELLEAILKSEDYTTCTAGSCKDALQLVEATPIDAILLDILLPDGSGMDVCSKIKNMPLRAHIPIIFITGHGDIETAVKAMESGAFYFLTKPIMVENLLLILKRALENSKLHREVALLRSKLGEGNTLMIGKSPKMSNIFQLIAQVSPRDTTVLIEGNSGTGKELVARTIHENSHRKEGPFVAIDCGAVSESLLESELFGHVKGAFTGAYTDHKGIFMRATEGTLFLDEIGNLPLSLQTKLLRALQEKEIVPVGGDKVHKINVRIIAATNMDLEKMMAQGTFRNDLFFRLNVVNIKIPDLKERREDIPLLVEHFLQKHRQKGNTQQFSKAAMKLLMNYDWPGNVRELQNTIEYSLVVASKAEIEPEDLPASFKVNESAITPGNLPPLYSLQEVERQYIEKVLEHTQYNQTLASQILKINRKSLWRKIKEFKNKQPN